jgi:hypothetical protein
MTDIDLAINQSNTNPLVRTHVRAYINAARLFFADIVQMNPGWQPPIIKFRAVEQYVPNEGVQALFHETGFLL